MKCPNLLLVINIVFHFTFGLQSGRGLLQSESSTFTLTTI